MRQQQPRGRSIFSTIMLPLTALLALQMIFLIALPIFSGVLKDLKTSKEDMLVQRVLNRKNHLETTVLADWSNLKNLSQSMDELTEQVLIEHELSIEDFLQDPAALDFWMEEAAENLVAEMYFKRVSGVYVMLTTSDLHGVMNSDGAAACPGLYFIDENPENSPAERRSDVHLKRGPEEIADQLSVVKDDHWKETFTFIGTENKRNYDFLYQPYQAAFRDLMNKDSKEYGFWSVGEASWLGETTPSFTYSEPLILSDGTLYGVVGVELQEDYLRKFLPYHELEPNQSSAYAFAKVREGTNGSLIIDRGLLSSDILTEEVLNQPLELVPIKNEINHYTCVIEDHSYYVSAEPFSFYRTRTQLHDQDWRLLGIVDKNELYMAAYKVQWMMSAVLILVFLTGVMGTLFISRRMSLPVQRLSEEVAQARSNATELLDLSKTGIREIDRFAKAITDLNRDVVNTSTRFLRILDMATSEIAGFEMRDNEPVYTTDNFFPIFGFRVEPGTVISNEEFIRFANYLRSTLLYTKQQDGSQIFEVTDKGGVIHYIRVSINRAETSMTGLAEDVTSLIMERQRIEHDRDYDLLTGLLNRRAFYREVDEVFRRPQKIRCAAFIMLDLDDLKLTNDTFGHEWGDRYIQQAARGFTSAVPKNSVVSRLGGDEFAVMLYGYGDEQELQLAVEAFEEQIMNNTFVAPDEAEHPVRASGGITWYPKDGTDFYELLNLADFAMYEVKHSVKGRIGAFDRESYMKASSLAQNRKELQKLLDDQLLAYHYQPIYSAKDGSVFAYEALMRVNMPTLRTPDAVLNLAQQEHKLKEIERLTMLKSTEFYAALLQKKQVDPTAYLFVNSIADQWIDEEDQKRMEERFSDFLSRVVIEITECNDIETEALEIKRRMKCFSGLFALDDYGSGYNGEKNLLAVEPKFVKIDISIIRGIDTDANKQRIVSNLIGYARENDIMVLAEGVETLGELHTVLKLGVDLLQGYVLARPAAVPDPIAAAALEEIQNFWNGQK